MTIYCLKKFSSQDQFDTSVEEDFFATRELAVKALDECRKSYKEAMIDGKPSFSFTEDSETMFDCTGGKWRYTYTVYPVDVKEA